MMVKISSKTIFIFQSIFLSIRNIACDTKPNSVTHGLTNRFDQVRRYSRLRPVRYFVEVSKVLLRVPEVFLDPPPATLEGLIGNPYLEDIVDYQDGLKSGDPELNITELIQKYGYPVETHQVETDDGYILTLFRIPNKGTPILLQHGLTGSSDDFVTLGPKKALSYFLANEGYDVWLGNARGNKHSLDHKYLSPDNDIFWDFSWDEMGRYDIPAVIDYMLKVSGKEKVQYIGHSQGTTTFFVMCSERPEYNDKVLFMVALAPVAWMSHLKSPVFRLLAPVAQDKQSLGRKLLGSSVLKSDSLSKVINLLLCENNFIRSFICLNVAFSSLGFDNSQIDFKALPTMVSHLASSASTKQFIHYAQEIKSGKFRRYDYKYLNKEIYGSETPPDYPVEKITVPIALFYGDSDWAVDIEDIKILMDHLKNANVTLHRVPYKSFAHLDFLSAKDVVKLLYNDVLKLLNDHNK